MTECWVASLIIWVAKDEVAVVGEEWLYFFHWLVIAGVDYLKRYGYTSVRAR